jgi:hypothetical protein
MFASAQVRWDLDGARGSNAGASSTVRNLRHPDSASSSWTSLVTGLKKACTLSGAFDCIEKRRPARWSVRQRWSTTRRARAARARGTVDAFDDEFVPTGGEMTTTEKAAERQPPASQDVHAHPFVKGVHGIRYQVKGRLNRERQ